MKREPIRKNCVARFMEDECVQDALFEIEGPDEDGCVWACFPEGPACLVSKPGTD
jgi:hypothetical protein